MLAPAMIAIVDDDAEVRGSLNSLLRSAGLRVRCFDGAAAFLAAAMLDRPDCLVTDLQMPGLDGLGLQAEVRRRGWALPVIVMTAFATEAACAAALQGGAMMVLTKPIDADGLLAAIAAALSQSL